MARRHRVRPNPRREPGYKVDIWRSIAVLIEGGQELNADSRRVLAAVLGHLFSDTGARRYPDLPLLPTDPDEIISIVKDLYDAGFLGVEDGRAFMSAPQPDALGRMTRIRLDREEIAGLSQAMLRSLREELP